MLKNIKSSYIRKKVYYLLYEQRKLDLFKYNKSIQKESGISIVNYSNFSGKYILFIEKGKAEEYDYEGNLVFKGVYSKGKRNGQGKEYFCNNKIKFEGEYLNGKKYKGKEFDIYGNLIFEGEYLNGNKIIN